MLAVTFHQNDNIREIAIQLPLVVDILQSKSCVGVPLHPCIFVRFLGVRIVLVPVSGQIELDDGLQNTIFHVGRRVAQVKAAGDPPVCLAVAGCLALDGDKVCGNVESRKIILCNGGRGGLSRMLAGTGKVKRFILRHLAVKHPFIFFVFQLELNRVNEVGRVFWICFMFATRVFAKLSDIDGFLDRDNNRPDTILLLNLLRSRKAAGQLAVLFALVGRCADAGDQIVWNFDARQSRCQIKCWRGFLRQCRRWEQTYNHDKAE